MIKLLFTGLGLLITIASSAQINPNNHFVKGYYKSNGTYVEGYYRTNPNSTINDNYSTYPNVNPYTGETGTIQPEYSAPSYSSPVYSLPTYSEPTYSLPTYDLPTNDLPAYDLPAYSLPGYDPEFR